jgi:hypothetical protein
MTDALNIAQLRAQARQKVDSQVLPSPEHLNGSAHAGSGLKCCVCELDIPKCRTNRDTVEYVVEWRRNDRLEVLRFHSDCFRAWVSLSPLVSGELQRENRC